MSLNVKLTDRQVAIIKHSIGLLAIKAINERANPVVDGVELEPREAAGLVLALIDAYEAAPTSNTPSKFKPVELDHEERLLVSSALGALAGVVTSVPQEVTDVITGVPGIQPEDLLAIVQKLDDTAR